LDSRLPSGFSVPNPSDDPTLREDEDPLEGGELELALSAPDPEFPELQLKEPEAGTVGYAGEAQAFAEAKAEFTETTDVVEPESEAAEVAELEARDLDVIEPEQGEAEAAEVAEPESDEAELDDDSDDAEDDELDEDDQDEDEPDDAEPDATDRDNDRKH
jgi:segregation and condensation protein B